MKEQIMILIFPDGEFSTKQENLIDTLIEIQKTKLSAWLPNVVGVPSELEYIIVETVIARYNRIGSEGMKKETVEGHAMEFYNLDISDFADDIQKYLDSLKEDATNKKVVKFL